jgi:hypothetical protein
VLDAGSGGDASPPRDQEDESWTRRDVRGGLQTLDSQFQKFAGVATEAENVEEWAAMVLADHQAMEALPVVAAWEAWEALHLA